MNKPVLTTIFIIAFFGLCYLAFIRVDSSERWELQTKLEDSEKARVVAKQELTARINDFSAWKVEAERRILAIAPTAAVEINKVFATEKFDPETVSVGVVK
ncbi:MAG: hypothetical protein HC888_02595 [Candidatus Competibacteraceae bacterium]|nr:hypothetical protein [Candidatus Competibacteraceae bacterium]